MYALVFLVFGLCFPVNFAGWAFFFSFSTSPSFSFFCFVFRLQISFSAFIRSQAHHLFAYFPFFLLSMAFGFAALSRSALHFFVRPTGSAALSPQPRPCRVFIFWAFPRRFLFLLLNSLRFSSCGHFERPPLLLVFLDHSSRFPF